MDKIYVSKRGLYWTAIGLWLFSGAKVLSIGIPAWMGSEVVVWNYVWLVIALVFFSVIIFPPVARENIGFVSALPSGKHPLWSCFKPSSWLVMVVMMSFGILLRLSGYVPESFVAGFYIGLGISLLGVALHYRAALREA